MLQEVEDAAVELQGLLLLDEPAQVQAGMTLASVKQAASKRVQSLLQTAYPLLVRAEFQRPGLLANFWELWSGQPDPKQGAETWATYLGAVRQLLLSAIEGVDPAGTAAGKINGYAALSYLPVQPVFPGRAAVPHAEAAGRGVRVQSLADTGATLHARLLTVEQSAMYLGRTKEAVQHMVAAGKIRTVRADRRVFLDSHDLDAWIENNKA